MNIQEKLFKIYNVIKHQSEAWDKALEETKIKEEFDVMTFYYAAYYGGSKDTAKILINLWNGDLTETEISRALQGLDNPRNMRGIN